MTVVELKANIDPSYYRLLYGQERGQLADMFQARRPSVEERLAAGKALREKVPRAAMRPTTSADRPDPVAILEQQNVERIQKLVPVRYARMLVSPFAFLRGSAAVMADDLSRTPITGLAVAACGDMHVSNFGVYASAERNLVFAINDFDEVHPGPWEWDLKRLAASAAVAARFMGGDKAAAPRRRRAPAWRAIAGACGAMPRWAISRSGTTRSTNARCSTPCRRACAATPNAPSPRRGPRAISARSTSSPSWSMASRASSRTCR